MIYANTSVFAACSRLRSAILNLYNSIQESGSRTDEEVESNTDENELAEFHHPPVCLNESEPEHQEAVVNIELHTLAVWVDSFVYTSFKSIHSGTKVSQGTNKWFKLPLHMAAISVTTHVKSGEYKKYHKQRAAEGKHPTSVLNMAI